MVRMVKKIKKGGSAATGMSIGPEAFHLISEGNEELLDEDALSSQCSPVEVCHDAWGG